MVNRRDLLIGTAAAAATPLRSIADAQAQVVDLLKIFVPAAPGGGWDQTGRTIEQVLRATGAVKGVQITNVGGAGGAVGLPQFLNSWRGQGNALMVAGMVMVGSLIANKSPVKLATATPIARLTGEFLALVVWRSRRSRAQRTSPTRSRPIPPRCRSPAARLAAPTISSSA